MQLKLPILEWWIDFKTRNTICTQVVGCSLLRVLSIQNLTVLIELQNIGEDGVNLLNRTWLISIQRKVIDAFEHAVRAAGHEVCKRPQSTTE